MNGRMESTISTGTCELKGSMSNLRFDFEWQDPAGARGEELRATWASLSILIDGDPVTELQEDEQSQFEPAFSSHCFRWPSGLPITGGSCNRKPSGRTLGASRSSIADTIFAGARRLCAAVTPFRELGEGVEAHWQSLDIADAGIRFLASGSAILSGSAFYRPSATL